MGMIKFEVPHRLARDEAVSRARKLLDHWGRKYGIVTQWNGDTASLHGKVMGISLEATMTITDNAVTGEATDPGILLRAKAKKYLEEKFNLALDPNRKPEDLMA
ncbi:MAG: polyhydroxyalkanoic acid system family protein [Myxococcaceae bacterium]|nr:polyhydroxyalkanoic acid system family protein [Myxococcaceae bacterium]